ncbi:hypothetical protein RhiirC2_789234 [Rhizophagus irregularis]|uniref:Protein kinase domain-containing protein n=1 Tax=Rhizophagus irregularis TaxID=588596 RepID=A0A2N1MNI7_9GLOM|nr:hypothetical protein RhiirC2_789234 [Rhizophagus irregularis]
MERKELIQLEHGKVIIKTNFSNWTSGNEKIDKFIQEKQLNYKGYGALFEWIPYNEFIGIKEVENGFKAIWKRGTLRCFSDKLLWKRNSCKEVSLKYLHNSQNVTDELLNEIKKYSGYGISQNPVTKDYIIVFSGEYPNYHENYDYTYDLKNNFTNWTSGNEIIDNFIQEKQSKYLFGVVFEWIPFNKFVDVKEIGNNCLTRATWGEGKLSYIGKEWIRSSSYEKVCLKYLYDSDEFLNKIESYLTKECYGIKLNNIKGYKTLFEWIPYSKFIEIKEINEKVGFTEAIWKDGFLHYETRNDVWKRNSYEKVYLKYLYDLQNITNEFINKVESYLIAGCYGISQNPDTKVYILVFINEYSDLYCKKCGDRYNRELCKSCQSDYLKNNFTNWTSGNEKIDKFIQEIQLKYDGYGDIFEWISYNEFIDVNEIGDNCLTTAIWKNGPLRCDTKKKEWIRTSYVKVSLSYLQYSNEEEIIDKIEKEIGYGISQNPDTNDYILIFSDYYYETHCEKCGKKYEFKYSDFEKWCKSCQMNHLKNNFINWTSGNEKVNILIQNTQLKINNCDDMIFEWILYNKFINVNEIGKSGIFTAIRREGSLHYSKRTKNYKRKLNEKAVLIYLNNSQSFCNNEFLNEIKYLIKESYGISQDPNTNDSILVSQDKYYCEKCGKKYDSELEINNKSCTSCQTSHEKKKINDLIQEMRLINNDYNIKLCGTILFEWISYDQFDDIREIGKGCYSTVYSAIWKDGLLYDKKINHQWKGIRKQEYKWERKPNAKVALKCLHNSKNFLDEFINKVKIYSNRSMENILKIYGISQNPNTNDYIMVFKYAEGGTFNNYLVKNHESFDWLKGLSALANIINGLNEIHQNHIVHRNFHIGNILFTKMDPDDKDYINYNYNHINDRYEACISDIGLFRKIGDTDKTNIYGVMPYVAPEVLKGKPYTRAADIYSFGMIMYVVATGKQPFANCAHDKSLILNIYSGVRPELNEKIAPKCYIDLMKKCWNLDPDNRPGSVEIKELIYLFYNLLNGSCRTAQEHHYEIRKQFEQTQEHRKENLLMIESNQLTTHTQVIYTSRLLNPFTSK